MAPLRGGTVTGGGAAAEPPPLVGLRDDVAREDEVTRVLRTHLTVGSGASIVEVGCGTGELSAWLAQTAVGVRVLGVDIDVAMVRRASDRAKQGALRQLSFAIGNAYHLPLEHASADLVICKNLLCVLANVDRAVREMLGVVKPGGLLVAIEPASAHVFHDPDDPDFAELSQGLNQAFYEGWRVRDVDQRIGMKVPGQFLRQRLTDIRVEAVSRVHLLADAQRSRDDIREQLETEAYRLPEPTVSLVLDGGMSRRDIEEHNRHARERLRRFHDNPAAAARSGYIRMNPVAIVTIGRRTQ